ncbi:MAG: MiaB/RimO family radical SAM methylthiotransferase, partial [Lachnospiraceae bacterium]|nr:MiaB/RimO family radical SAM methylthiotransferase [Lachnospiraceae bacterium]
DINHTSEYEEMTLEQMHEHTRAYIKVQDGCNQFCSYCIIPYARGRVRSRKINDIKKEVTSIADKGFKEVVITGIHVSSYGVDFGEDRERLIDVIETAASVDGIERVRLSSLEPRIITKEFMERLSHIKEICPHFHLSLQSGCDTVLKRMNRKYTTSEYLEGCRCIRNIFPNAAITTDIIVGFPGETETEFNTTLSFAREVGFAEIHVFKYSKRQGTVAAAMENQVDDLLKADRSRKLIELEYELRKDYRNRFFGENKDVLFEQSEIIDGTQYYTGFTKEYVKIAAASKENLANRIIDIKVKEIYNHEILLAEM